MQVLLRGREELLTPGKKKELLQALIPLLYFDYEITYTLTGINLSYMKLYQLYYLIIYFKEEELEDKRRKSSNNNLNLVDNVLNSESSNQADIPHSQEISILNNFQSQSQSQNQLETETETENLNLNLNLNVNEESNPHDKVILEKENTLYIHHLDKFKLPPGYPQSIADIIREISSTSDLVETLLPKKLTQILKIR